MPRSERKEEEARGVVFCGPPELDGVSRVGKVVFLGFLLLEENGKNGVRGYLEASFSPELNSGPPGTDVKVGR